MENKLFNYLVEELYPLQECDNCQHNDGSFYNRKCYKCGVGADSRFKLHEGIQADVRKMVKGIMKIVKENGSGKT